MRSYPRRVFILIPILVSGCGLFSDGVDWRYSPMHPVEILSVESGGYSEKVVFEIASYLNTPCYSYSHAEVKYEGTNIFVGFFQKSDGQVACPDVVVDTEILWSFRPRLRGEYTFHFRRSDSTSLDTTLTFR
jgi:hypothetical protein